MDVAAIPNGVFAAEDAGDRFRISKVFLFEDAHREDFGGVVVMNGHGLLQDDHAVIDSLVDEMNGTAGDLCAVVECLSLRVKPWGTQVAVKGER